MYCVSHAECASCGQLCVGVAVCLWMVMVEWNAPQFVHVVRNNSAAHLLSHVPAALWNGAPI